jgi:hypothetical protein
LYVRFLLIWLEEGLKTITTTIDGPRLAQSGELPKFKGREGDLRAIDKR